jgi:hypothetical protein
MMPASPAMGHETWASPELCVSASPREKRNDQMSWKNARLPRTKASPMNQKTLTCTLTSLPASGNPH